LAGKAVLRQNVNTNPISARAFRTETKIGEKVICPVHTSNPPSAPVSLGFSPVSRPSRGSHLRLRLRSLAAQCLIAVLSPAVPRQTRQTGNPCTMSKPWAVALPEPPRRYFATRLSRICLSVLPESMPALTSASSSVEMCSPRGYTHPGFRHSCRCTSACD